MGLRLWSSGSPTYKKVNGSIAGSSSPVPILSHILLLMAVREVCEWRVKGKEQHIQ